MKEDVSVCPDCGTTLVPKNLDGSFLLDGSGELSGMKCPKCSQLSEAEDSDTR